MVPRCAIALFCLLCSCSVLRPLRGAIAIQIGVTGLPWLITATLLGVVALFAISRRSTTAAYALCLGALFAPVGPLFVIAIGIFNVGVIALFWTSMGRLFDARASRRAFGPIAAGGSLGGILGPLIAIAVPGPYLVLVATSFLTIGIGCVPRIECRPAAPRMRSQLLAGSCVMAGCYTVLSTLLYFAQVDIISRSIPDVARQTSCFAWIDFAANVLALGLQFWGTSALVSRFGLGVALACVPAAIAIGFAMLGTAPILAVVAVLQVVHRAGSFAIMRPGREMLFAGDTYEGKGFVDTALYRGGDVVGAWLFSSVRSAGASALVGIPVALIWMTMGFLMGRRHDAHAA